MNSLSFPDVNVWFALLYQNHQQRESALRWWETTPSKTIGMSRFAQMGALRLMTTASVMGGQPFTMAEAWNAYYRLYRDGRVAYFAEAAALDREFEALTKAAQSSPKAWADAFLLAFARCHGGELITFDQGLRNQPDCLILHPET